MFLLRPVAPSSAGRRVKLQLRVLPLVHRSQQKGGPAGKRRWARAPDSKSPGIRIAPKTGAPPPLVSRIPPQRGRGLGGRGAAPERLCGRKRVATRRLQRHGPPARPAPEVSCSGAPPGAATSEAGSCRRRSHGECGGRARGPLPGSLTVPRVEPRPRPVSSPSAASGPAGFWPRARNPSEGEAGGGRGSSGNSAGRAAPAPLAASFLSLPPDN